MTINWYGHGEGMEWLRGSFADGYRSFGKVETGEIIVADVFVDDDGTWSGVCQWGDAPDSIQPFASKVGFGDEKLAMGWVRSRCEAKVR